MDYKDAAFQCVKELSLLFHIDESHSLKHAMEVLSYTMQSYRHHVYAHPYLIEQQKVLYTAAIVHDMCDKKYVDETVGLRAIHERIGTYFTPEEFNILTTIMTSISYSAVRSKGYPVLHEWQLTYHIVREADLLSAYDIDRTIIYGMYRENLPYSESVARSKLLYYNRVMRYISDGLFMTDWGYAKAHELHGPSSRRMNLEL